MRRLDVISPEFQHPQVSLLHAQIQRSFRLLTHYTGELTQEQIEYRGPAGDRNSIATLIAHLTATDVFWLYKLQEKELEGEWAVLGKEMDASPMPAVKGLSAKELLARYEQVLTSLKEYLLTLTDGDLERVIRLNDEVEVTVRWALNHISEHSAMHRGHIIWLKGWQQPGAEA